MKIRVILLVALIIPTWPAFSEGAKAGDLAMSKEAADNPDYAKASSGKPLRVKARFVRELTDVETGRRRGKKSGSRLGFLVVAKGGEMRCEMSPRTKGAKAIRGMKRATPVVIRGTLDAQRNVFLVDSIVQGWGRDQMGDDS